MNNYMCKIGLSVGMMVAALFLSGCASDSASALNPLDDLYEEPTGGSMCTSYITYPGTKGDSVVHRLYEHEWYDGQDRVVMYKQYDDVGQPYHLTQYVYDAPEHALESLGKTTEIKEYSLYHGEPLLDSHRLETFDHQGNLVGDYAYSEYQQEAIEHTSYWYNEANQRTQAVKYYHLQEYEKWEYTYAGDTCSAKGYRTDSTGLVSYSVQIKDQQGRLAKMLYYEDYHVDHLAFVVNYTYGANGKVATIEMIQYKDAGYPLVDYSEYSYNNANQVTRIQHSAWEMRTWDGLKNRMIPKESYTIEKVYNRNSK